MTTSIKYPALFTSNLQSALERGDINKIENEIGKDRGMQLVLLQWLKSDQCGAIKDLNLENRVKFYVGNSEIDKKVKTLSVSFEEGLSIEERVKNGVVLFKRQLGENLRKEAGDLLTQFLASELKDSYLKELYQEDFFLNFILSGLSQNTLLHSLVNSGKVEAVRAVVKNCPKEFIFKLYSQNSYGRTPLHNALILEEGEIFEELIKGVPKDELYRLFVRDKDGMTPLHLAVKKGNVELFRKLIKASERVDLGGLFDKRLFELASVQLLPALLKLIPKDWEPFVLVQLADLYLEKDKITEVDLLCHKFLGKDLRKEYLREVFKSRSLASYFMRNYLEEIKDYLEKLIEEGNISPEIERSILPFLTAENIKRVIEGISSKEKEALLNTQVVLDEGEAGYPRTLLPLNEALEEIRKQRIEQVGWGESAFFQEDVKKFIDKLPLDCLAAAATDERYKEVFLKSYFLLSDYQIKCVVPFWRSEEFLRVVKDLKEVEKHLHLLRGATDEHKEEYIKAWPFEKIYFSDWEEKRGILKRGLLDKNLNDEKIETLKLLLKSYSAKIALRDGRVRTLKQLGSVLVLGASLERLKKRVDEGVKGALLRMVEVEREFRTIQKEIEEVIFARGKKEPPEDFLDPITGELMRDPVIIPGPGGNIVDLKTIPLLKGKNPFNNLPFAEREVLPAAELKALIDKWL